MFQGFTDAIFEFFMAIQFNNNTEFFHSNHDWYVDSVRQPCLELAAALSEPLSVIDNEIEFRPNRVVSRINRDLRYSRDKSPYRDSLWLRLRRPADPNRANVGFYFDISATQSSFGMGFYEECKPHMNGLRRRLTTEPEAFLGLTEPLRDDFGLYMNAYKRIRRPDSLPDALHDWYGVRSFWFYQDIKDFSLLKSPALVDFLAAGFNRLAPLYHYIREIPNESDEDLTRFLRERDALQ